MSAVRARRGTTTVDGDAPEQVTGRVPGLVTHLFGPIGLARVALHGAQGLRHDRPE
jgi:hypothetical protein